MTISLIKKKLYDYIENGDPKKVKAFYAMVENEIEEQPQMDDAFWKEIDKRAIEMDTNFSKGLTLNQMISNARKAHFEMHK